MPKDWLAMKDERPIAWVRVTETQIPPEFREHTDRQDMRIFLDDVLRNDPDQSILWVIHGHPMLSVELFEGTLPAVSERCHQIYTRWQKPVLTRPSSLFTEAELVAFHEEYERERRTNRRARNIGLALVAGAIVVLFWEVVIQRWVG